MIKYQVLGLINFFEDKIKLIRADYIFIVALVLLISAHIVTNFIINYYQDVAKTVGATQEAVLIMENNPVARYFFTIAGLKNIFSYIIAPGVLSGLYWFLRHKYANQKEALEGYAISFFVIFLIDFSNDLSILLGVLA